MSIFDDIQLLCRDFRQELKAGDVPRIEDYLQRVDESAQENLFQNLLHLEIQFSAKEGHELSSDGYHERFPRLGRVIRQAFFESTRMSQLDQETPGEQTLLFDAPAARKLGEYELLRQIGKGGFGAVYRARHLQRGETVALKLLPIGSDANRLHLFRNEYKKMADINHPNLVGMQALERDGDQWFFTMDLVEGTDFLDWVRPENQLDESRLRDALKQLADGVIALHRHRNRIVHRDLKPSNVMVTHDGRVQILDFGLVIEQDPQDGRTLSISVAGTPDYMAPEQIAGEATAESDWYAVGVILYESLTGELPFPQREGVLLKQNKDAPRLTDRDDVPQDLAVLGDQLLSRDPSERPAISAIVALLGLDVSGISTFTFEMESATSHDGALIGRESQLAQLDTARTEFLETRAPSVIWIAGLSGEGKSALADKFLSPLRRNDELLVLSGRCYDRESVPFKAVDVLIEALSGFLRSRPAEQVRKWLPNDIHLLAHLFPSLRRVSAIDEQAAVGSIANIDDRQIRYRAFFALRDMLVTISRETPLVLFIDDLQWGDADSAEVLTALLAPPNPPALLFVGSYRSDEAQQSPFLREWNARIEERTELTGRVVEVQPLTEEQCLEFVAGRVGIELAALREQVRDTFADTRGNPYFLEQLIEGFNSETGQFEPVPLSDVIARKLNQLPNEAGDLLNAIAIAGQAVSIAEVSRVAGHETPLFSTITHMRSERLVRLIGSDEQQVVDTYHDKIRETQLDSLGETNRRSWHTRSGELLEQQEQVNAAELLAQLQDDESAVAQSPTDRLYDLAYHFHEAGDRRSFTYQLLAGEHALRTYAIEEAFAFYQRAGKQLPSNLSRQLQYRLWLANGRVMLWKNLPDVALTAYEAAEHCASDSMQRAKAFMGQGRVLNQIGQFDNCIAQYDKALEQLESDRPASLPTTLAYTLLTAMQIVLVPAKYLRSGCARTRDRALLVNQICAIIETVFPEKYFLQTLAIQLRGSRAALRTGRPASIACGYAQIAFMSSGFGAPWIGNLLLRRARRIEANVDSPAIRAQFIMSTGMAQYWGGQLTDARISLGESAPLLLRCGNTYGQMVTTHVLRHTLGYVSTTSEEIDAARDVLSLASETGNVQCKCWALYDVASALARRGALTEAMPYMHQSLSALTDERFNMTTSIRAATCGYVLLQASQYNAARDSAAAGWALVMKCPLDVTVLNLPDSHREHCRPNLDITHSNVGQIGVEEPAPLGNPDPFLLPKSTTPPPASRWSSLLASREAAKSDSQIRKGNQNRSTERHGLPTCPLPARSGRRQRREPRRKSSRSHSAIEENGIRHPPRRKLAAGRSIRRIRRRPRIRLRTMETGESHDGWSASVGSGLRNTIPPSGPHSGYELTNIWSA